MELDNFDLFEQFLEAKVKRTHFVMKKQIYAISFQDNDDTEYVSYEQLKLYLTRRELMKLYKNIRCGVNYLSNMDNATVRQVLGGV